MKADKFNPPPAASVPELPNAIPANSQPSSARASGGRRLRRFSGQAVASVRPARADGLLRPLYALQVSALARFFMKQSPSYWFISLYLFLEYVRPQQIYTWLDVLPWSKTALVLAGICFLVEGRRIRWGMTETCLAIFSAIVLASSITAIYPDVSLRQLSDFFNWVIIFILIANTVDTEGRLLVFVLMFMVWNFKMSLFGTRSWAADGFAFRDWGTTGSPGLFQNSGEFAIEMCVFAAMLAGWIVGLRKHWPRWKLLVWLFVGLTSITSLVAANSRGAILGVAAVGLTWLVRTKYKWRALVACVAIAGFIYAVMPEESRARYTTMGDDATSVQRTTYWKQGLEMLQSHPALGIGYKNWFPYHTVTYDGFHQAPHNIFIEVASELGYAGFFGFIALIAATLVLNRRTRLLLRNQPNGAFMSEMSRAFDAALLGYLVSGFFVTVFYYPYFWINLAFSMALYNAARSSLEPHRPTAVRRRRQVSPAT